MDISLTYNNIEYINFNTDALLAEGVPESIIQESLLNQAWEGARVKRNQLLAQCDWTQITDVDMTSEQKQAWLDYRQALRDIPAQTVEPQDIEWPVSP
ncbi:tail fiber assembly protein [Pseudoalteromonas umbrosa]|uniref:tail fiber assembly protein n=1 Tax=Pseudoalteromonas umbrosa TaxID=3048489 RepID=UPI0024C3426E|nr:tail fiber assembly protein [Pseudoalteromonas sp. B95]MDK1287384.1 tail fiber assembly protein [Pseudoalteromonas sp. B95]